MRKVHNENVHNSLPETNTRIIQSRRTEYMRHVTKVREINVHRISVRRPKQKKSPWKFNCEKNNIKEYIKVIPHGCVDCICQS